jgi:regulator of PEP synthase PpsR (kinase-PPPase family)
MSHAQQLATARRALEAARLDHIESTNDLNEYRVLRSKVRNLVDRDASEAGAAYLAELDEVVAELERQTAIYRETRDKKAAALDRLIDTSPFVAVGFYNDTAE